jgi:TM2 domain-containing membrane protein YozV
LAAGGIAFASAGAQPAPAPGRSGIPEIDSLPLQDWGGPSHPLPYGKIMTLSALVPGAGQIYGNHPVRGGFLIGLETLLTGLAAYSNLVDIPHWRSQARDALDQADLLFLQESLRPDSASDLEVQRRKQIAYARDRSRLAAQQQDLANSEFAWAIGLHAYGILDAAEIAWRSRHRDEEPRSVRRALFLGLIFPGGGQLYNHRYGKFGMLWMTIGASVVSAWSRQEMVDLFNRRLAIARSEPSSTGADALSDMEKDRTLYRKRRNQYYWGMALFYVYAVLDGMVDASLSDFDAPTKFALGPSPEGGMALAWEIPF